MSNQINSTLGDLVKAGGGVIHTGPFGSQLHAKDYVAQGIPCIMPANMKDNRVDLSSIAYITEEDAQRLSKYLVKEGDIVYSRRGNVTLKALIRKNEVGYFCGTGCLLLRPGNLLDSDYLTYYLTTPKIQSWIISQAIGATMPNLNTGILARIPFSGPEKVVQEKISSVLRAIDDKLELNNQINAELEAMAKTLYDYWFVQFDFPDANGKPYKTSGGEMEYNATLKREIPAGWTDCQLGNIIVRSGTGLNPRDNFILGKGNNYYVTIKNVRNGKIILDDRCDKIDSEALEIIDRRSQLQAGDILFTSIEPVGVTYFIHEKPVNWNINESVFTLRPDIEKVTSEYLYFLLSSDEIKIFTKNSSSGSVHKGIRHGILKSYTFAYSERKIIDKFSNSIKPILKRIYTLDQENQSLTKLRDWLLPLLMNGQVTVKQDPDTV